MQDVRIEVSKLAKKRTKVDFSFFIKIDSIFNVGNPTLYRLYLKIDQSISENFSI
tara:strand:- start:4044 stop:4208 length:165 start_codon:yes stop_codon:yes gene_type:complete